MKLSKFEKVPEDQYPFQKQNLISVWRNRDFLVQVQKDGDRTRITVNKTPFKMKDKKPIWADGITWDELFEIKNEIGFSDYWLVEIFPPKNQLINVANMRHLWVCAYEEIKSMVLRG